MKKILTLTLLILTMTAAYALAVTPPVKEFAAKVQAKYKDINSIHATFSQTLLHKESGGKQTRQGVMVFQKPFLLRWDVKSPETELLLVTGKEIWNEFPDEEITYKYPVSMIDDPSGILQVVTGQAKLDQDFTIFSMKDSGTLVLLEAYPNEPSQQVIEVRLLIEPKELIIKRVVIVDFFGNENDIVFEDIKVNQKVDAKNFKYSLPKGFQVEDRTNTEDSTGQQKLLQ